MGMLVVAVLGSAPAFAAVARPTPPEVVALTRQASMTASARKLFLASHSQLVGRDRIAEVCPAFESESTFVLGCFTGRGRIYVLQVDQPELLGVMPVTAAHEMLHAAYKKLSSDERKRVNKLVDQAFAATTDQRLRDLVDEYRRSEPGQRHNELHSLLATEVAELPRPLERYYRRYFRNRQEVVATFSAYEAVFDGLQSQGEQLRAEIDGLEAQLDPLRGQVDAANAEANSLGGEISALRAQGRIAESNQLVGPQNAAVNRARALVDEFNGLVAEHNAKVDQLNALVTTSQRLDESLRPI